MSIVLCPLSFMKVQPVTAQILRNHIQLLHSLTHQPSHLIQYLLLRPARMSSRNQRYRAIRTHPVATLAYLQICIMGWGSEMPLIGSSARRCPAEFCRRSNSRRYFAEPLNHPKEVELSVILIYLRQLFLQLSPIPLAQTTHHNQLPQLALFLPLCHLQNHVDALFFGVADESAGIDHAYLAFRFLRVMDTFPSCRLQLPHHTLCIHQILRASQRYKIHYTPLHEILIFNF